VTGRRAAAIRSSVCHPEMKKEKETKTAGTIESADYG